jgi:hypothetical protein
MYATDIEPLDAGSIAEVSTSCFEGEDLLIEVLRWDGRAWVLVAGWDGYEMTVHQ